VIQQQPRLQAVSKVLGGGILVIQLFDIAIHAATDQIEPLRVASNLIVMAWVALVMAGIIREKVVLAVFGSVGTYLALNGLFLLREGVTNPAQGGELRVTLLLLVGVTLGLSALLTYLLSRNQR